MLSRFKNSYFSYVLLYTGYYLVFSLYSSVLAVYLAGIGLSDQELSLILSAAGVFSFFVAPISGYLTDRVKNQKLAAGLMLAGIGGFALVFALCRSLWALFLLNGMVMSLINSITPFCERVAGNSSYRYGVLRVWGTLGYAAGAQGAGLAIERLPGPALFVLVAGACLITLIGLAGVELRPQAPAAENAQAEKKGPKLSALAGNPQFFLFLGAAALFAGCSGVNINYSPVLLTTIGVPTGMVGTVLFFSTLVEVPLILFSHKFMDRLGGKTLTAICFVLAIAQYLVYGLVLSPAGVVAVMIGIKAIASTLYMMLCLKMVRCLLPGGLTTTGLAVVASVTNLSQLLLQNLGGWVASASGIRAMYLGMAILCGAGLALTGFLQVKNEEKVFG